MDDSPPRALLFRSLGLGDLLTAVPAIRAVRDRLPEHELVLATSAALHPLVELIGGVDTVLPTLGLAAFPNPGPVDVAVNLHGRGPQSTQLLAALRPGRLVAWGPAARWRDDEHEVARWCRLVATGLGAPYRPGDLRLARSAGAAPATDVVVVHPGAAARARQWPAERFAVVARGLAEQGTKVVVTGAAAEHDLAERVRRAAGLPDTANLAGTTLLDLARVISDARLVICGDTGVGHLASAYGAPSVLLFGPVSPAAWGPPGRPEHVVLWRGDGRGDPHGTEPDPALLATGTDEVLAAAQGLLGSGRRTPADRVQHALGDQRP